MKWTVNKPPPLATHTSHPDDRIPKMWERLGISLGDSDSAEDNVPSSPVPAIVVGTKADLCADDGGREVEGLPQRLYSVIRCAIVNRHLAHGVICFLLPLHHFVISSCISYPSVERSEDEARAFAAQHGMTYRGTTTTTALESVRGPS